VNLQQKTTAGAAAASPARERAGTGLSPVLTASGIEKSYRRGVWPLRRSRPVLTGADLVLYPGEVVGLVGENGSGKSTLMMILVGALAADAGTVTRNGRLGYCPQEPQVYGRLTCDEHFELFGHAYALRPVEELRSRREIYAALGFERYAHTRADQLSGGTLAKLNLGLALLADPDLLLLDEPYAGFDWDTYLRFWELVAARRAGGRTVLIISHFVVDEDRFDRIVGVRDGAGGATWSAGMSTALFVRRFLSDYARNPVNLLLLVVVPVVFVVVAGGALADSARLLGGAGGGPAVETATAGWAAGFLAATAMYFQVSAAREADRRLVIAGLPAARLVGARLVAGLALALLASTAALVALALRTGVDDLPRVAAGVGMYAVIYLAIGAVVGATVRSQVNGTVLILFVWIVDVFFGPTLSAADSVFTRGLPTHFVSLWMVDLPSRHGGQPGDLGWALVWTAGAAAVAFAVVAGTTRSARSHRRHATPGSVRDQVAAGFGTGWRDWRRNPVLWVLLAVVPAVFVLLSDAITPPGATPATLVEGGRRITEIVDPAHVHAGTMAPIGIASLATLAGLFVVLDAATGDRRLALAGMRTGALLTARLAVVLGAALLATAVSLAVTAAVFIPHQWGVYAVGNALIAITYGLLGVLLGPIFGRVSGVFVAFLVPFLDIGIGQSPMVRGEPAPWALVLPGYGGVRIVIDGALTATFDETGGLLLALAWIVGLALAAAVLFRRIARPAAG
jgi:ABC-type Mn2+/Zn2+ transport system ATPase subunit